MFRKMKTLTQQKSLYINNQASRFHSIQKGSIFGTETNEKVYGSDDYSCHNSSSIHDFSEKLLTRILSQAKEKASLVCFLRLTHNHGLIFNQNFICSQFYVKYVVIIQCSISWQEIWIKLYVYKHGLNQFINYW